MWNVFINRYITKFIWHSVVRCIICLLCFSICNSCFFRLRVSKRNEAPLYFIDLYVCRVTMFRIRFIFRLIVTPAVKHFALQPVFFRLEICAKCGAKNFNNYFFTTKLKMKGFSLLHRLTK